VQHGFVPLDDGRVRLCCTPEIEYAMLRPIYEAMEQVYVGDARGNPFAGLAKIECPVRVTTAVKSGPIYKEMARRAVSLIPRVSTLVFEGAGHCVAQEVPERVVEAVREFAK
jgi:pimeloyl-ACP methyl ester carboxylesterase